MDPRATDKPPPQVALPLPAGFLQRLSRLVFAATEPQGQSGCTVGRDHCQRASRVPGGLRQPSTVARAAVTGYPLWATSHGQAAASTRFDDPSTQTLPASSSLLQRNTGGATFAAMAFPCNSAMPGLGRRHQPDIDPRRHPPLGRHPGCLHAKSCRLGNEPSAVGQAG